MNEEPGFLGNQQFLLSEFSDTLFFSMTALASVHTVHTVHTVQQASSSSACELLRQLDRLRGHALSTSSHNLTACRARKLITQMCTVYFKVHLDS